MRILLAIMIYIAASVSCTAQRNQLMGLDNDAAKLMVMTDANEYSYEHQLWTERAQRIISAIDIDTLNAYEPQALQRLSIPEANTTILYYLRPVGNEMSIDWISRYEDAETHKVKVYCFSDMVHTPLPTGHKAVVRATFSRDMIGFEVADSLPGRRLFWMPDLRIRHDFETLADVKEGDNEKDRAEDIIRRRLRALFSYDDALTVNTEGLPRLYTLSNEKETVRIVTYMTTYNSLESRCNGLVLRRNSNGTIDMFELTDLTAEIGSPERNKLNSEKWYGAVYYSMVEAVYEKVTYYTLLGFKSNDGMVKTRVLDVMWFKGKKCMFGAPIFEHEKATYCRRVFQYAAGANMMMRYDSKIKSIVFDHLAPENSMFVREYRFYGPDWSYDSYFMDKKHWTFKEDIELRNN